MIKEIERKFLVDPQKLPKDLAWEPVVQGYLSFEPQVRVRFWRDQGELTIKSAGSFVRDEWNYAIPADQAKELLKLCGPHIIHKERALVMWEGKEWCIDRFSGVCVGLITAEVELASETESVTLPPWVTTEVTGNTKYLNINLVRNPL